MAAQYEIRADYDTDTIVVYQAYAPAIADAALRAGRFVAPFSFHRMTWIKPSSRGSCTAATGLASPAKSASSPYG